MTDDDYRDWKNRVYNPAARRAGLASVRPYDLRHAFVSLLLAEGRSVVDVAAQAGHAPTMTLDTYAHVMADLDGADDRSADAVIAAARTSVVRVSYARVPEKEVSDDDSNTKAPHLQGFREEPSGGLEPPTPSLPSAYAGWTPRYGWRRYQQACRDFVPGASRSFTPRDAGFWFDGCASGADRTPLARGENDGLIWPHHDGAASTGPTLA